MSVQSIAYLNAPTGSAALRAASYTDTMAREGLQQFVRVVQTDLTEQSGFEAMSRLLDGARPPTAVFAANDTVLAIGALSAADERSVAWRTGPCRNALKC